MISIDQKYCSKKRHNNSNLLNLGYISLKEVFHFNLVVPLMRFSLTFQITRLYLVYRYRLANFINSSTVYSST